MLGTVARLLLLRVLPRRILPILTVVEVAQLLRAVRRQRAGAGRRQPAPRAAGRPADDRWQGEFDAHRVRTGATTRAKRGATTDRGA